MFSLKRICACVCSESGFATDLGHVISNYSFKIISISFTILLLPAVYYLDFLIIVLLYEALNHTQHPGLIWTDRVLKNYYLTCSENSTNASVS